MAYDVILADPPWRYGFSRSNSREIENQYPTLALSEIKALPIAAMTHPGTALLLWATAPLLAEALEVLRAWGFAYRTGAVWDKQKIGMGYWFRGQHEHLLVGARRDSKPPAQPDRVSSVFNEKRGRHSRKPECVYEWIERAWPTARKLELFARQPREGWHVWGNEVQADVSLVA